MTFAELGRRVNLSPPAVAERVRRLEDAGILRGYQWIKHLRDLEGADVLMAHDAEGFKKHKHSPEFYE